MEKSVTRKAFIGGMVSLLFLGITDSGDGSELIRPPGALDEALFLATCLRCGKCAQICPQQAIRMGRGDKGRSLGTPYIEARRSACDLCLKCIPVCTSGALRPTDKEKVRMGLACIDKERCLAWQGDECKICYISCPFYNQAIVLEEYKRPVVNRDVCVGCGICEHVCIVEPAAITVRKRG